jgi:hypothetical protein
VKLSPQLYDPASDTGGWKYTTDFTNRTAPSNSSSGYNSLIYWMHEFEAKGYGDPTVMQVAVQMDTTQAGCVSYVDDVTPVGDTTFNLEDGKLIPLSWDGYCTSAERVIVGSTLITRWPYSWPYSTPNLYEFFIYGFSQFALNYYTINFTTGKIDFYTYNSSNTDTYYSPNIISSGTRIKVLYSTGAHEYNTPHGRYEWITVGRDAATVDSAGASLVSEAFDSTKDISLSIAGADMASATTANTMPSVMDKWGGTGDTWADYYKTPGTDYRTALKDDWCTQYPVATSNMIGVGGPLANMLAYYSNDFADAIYGLTAPAAFAGSAYAGKITGVACWNRGWNGTWNTYSSSTTTTKGYAVISTYKDLNGTTVFLIWGHYGRDTYYASKWFHDSEITELQSAPRGVTSIIVQITYSTSDPTHPTFNIVECLGTISETLWTYGLATYKGGIHDP